MAQKIGQIAYTLARQILVKDKGGIASLPQNKEILTKVNEMFNMLKAGGYTPISAEKAIKSTDDLKRVLTDVEMKLTIDKNLRSSQGEGIEEVMKKMDKGIPLNPSDQAKMEGIEKVADDKVLDAFRGFEPVVIQGGKSEGIEKLLKSGDVKRGVAPKTIKKKPAVDPELQAMDDQNQMFEDFSARNLTGIDAMKEANLLIGRKGRYKNISEGDAKTKLNELQEIINKANAEPDSMAQGGRIGMNRGGGIIKYIKTLLSKKKKSPSEEFAEYLKKQREESARLKKEFMDGLKPGGTLEKNIEKSTGYQFPEVGKDFRKKLLEKMGNRKDNVLKEFDVTGRKPNATGGIIGLKEGGPPSKGRRNFLKLMGGLASIPVFGKLFKAAKPAAKVAKTAEVASQASGVPTYFPKLVEKIKMLGDDVTEIAATKDRQKVTEYKGYQLTEDIDTGKKEIKLGNEYSSEEYMIYEPPETIIGKNNKSVEVPAQYDEVTVRPDMDGKMKDVDNGLDSIDEIMREADMIETNYKIKPDGRPKKAGGGVAHMLGE